MVITRVIFSRYEIDISWYIFNYFLCCITTASIRLLCSFFYFQFLYKSSLFLGVLSVCYTLLNFYWLFLGFVILSFSIKMLKDSLIKKSLKSWYNFFSPSEGFGGKHLTLGDETPLFSPTRPPTINTEKSCPLTSDQSCSVPSLILP